MILRILFFAAWFTIAAISAALPTQMTLTGAGGVTATVPIGTPVGIGQNSGASGTTVVVTTSAAIVSGDLVVVAIGYNSAAQTVSTVSDGTNTYAKAVGTKNGSGGNEVWYIANAAAVSSGASVTVTYTASVTQPIALVARVTGITATPLDKTNTATATSVASGTLTQANELVIGTLGGFNMTAITEDASFTNIYSVQQDSSQVWENLAYKIVNATTSVVYQPTFTGAGASDVFAIATFKGN